MRFNCGPTREEKREAKKQWHRYFALFPVRVGPRDCRWLEFIERKGTFWSSWYDCGWNWEYRALK